MKRKRYDYSGFSLSRMKEPRFKHVLFLGTWLVYFALYFLTENLIPQSACHVVNTEIDNYIPFCEYFVFFYCGWYLLVAGSLGYYFFYDPKRFRQLEIYIFVTQLVAMAVYIIWPSVQLLRPEVFPRENVCTWILGIIYAFDTPTGVCPSLHVAYSLAIVSVVCKDECAAKWVKVLVVLFTVGVCFAVLFVKQHAFVDVLVGIPTALIGEFVVYHSPLSKKIAGEE